MHRVHIKAEQSNQQRKPKDLNHASTKGTI